MNIIDNYKRKQKIRNMSIVMFSITLAILFSTILNQTWFWLSIKSSVLESSWIKKNTNEKSDLYIEKNNATSNNIFSIKNSNDLVWVKSISLSIFYNDENINLESKILKIDWWEMIDLTKNNWYNTILINFKNTTNIKKNEEIIQLVMKKNNNWIENINIVWANFIDKDNVNYNLSTSGISF